MCPCRPLTQRTNTKSEGSSLNPSMIEVYTHHDASLVGFYRTLLEDAGIRTHFRNEFISGAEVMIPVFYPAICVLEPEDEERARQIIHSQSAPVAASGPDWKCPSCNETVPSTFNQCWNCSATYPEV